MVFGQIQTTLNFYFYGKKHFTQTGYAKNVKAYKDPKFLDDLGDQTGRVYMITGSNQGIGKEMALFAAKKNATVFMVCRSLERGRKAQEEISAVSGNPRVIVLQADVSLEADVRRMWAEFIAHPLSKRGAALAGAGAVAGAGAITDKVGGGGGVEEPAALDELAQPSQLHGLVCNAGALLNERTMTAEGVETTFAAHLLFGTYLLGDLAMDTLHDTPGSRMIIVSSGGMYNYPLPEWEVMSSTHQNSQKDYSGQTAYAYAKRGQVVLAEHWAKIHEGVKVVTCHPGWTLSEGVESAYGDTKSYLQPMRTTWEGAEGICWLMFTPAKNIEPGAFYLDREPQPKHIAGAFYYEGSATKNTPQEVEMFLENLHRWGAADSDGALTRMWRPSPERTAAKLQYRTANPECPPASVGFDLPTFMKKWHVLANIPIFFSGEHLLCNPYEHYTYDDKRKLVQVRFTSTPLDSQTSQVALMHGTVRNEPLNTKWTLNPKIFFYLPLNLGYVILHVAEDYSWCLVGVPSRANLWIMTAKRPLTKDAVPWPAGAAETFRSQTGCQGISGAEVSCTAERGKVAPVFNGTGVNYKDDMSPELTAEEEVAILKVGLLKAEALGWDINQVRLCGWRSDIP